MTPLHIDTRQQLDIRSEALVGISSAILGISGSGKSNTAAVLIEELLATGFPMTIVDIDSDHWGLKEKFDVLVAGRSPHCDIQIGLEHAEKLVELSTRKRIPVVLDMNEFGHDEMLAFLLTYFTRLWEVSTSLRQPYQIVIEEAHEFVPQGVRTPLKDILTRIALRGRKRGLSTLLISQRSPKVEKDLLTQAQLMFLHKVVHPVDLRVYQDLIPLPAKQVDEIVGKLGVGEAIVLYKNTPTTIHIRQRETFHAGATPLLGKMYSPTLRKIDTAILAELQHLAPTPIPVMQPTEQVQRRIKELEQKNNDQTLEIKRLQAKIQSLTSTQLQPRPVVTTAIPYETRDQQKLFGDLLMCIDKLPRAYHRTVLKFLLEREGKPFRAKEIARIVDLQPSTVRSASSALIGLGLVQQLGTGVNAQYASSTQRIFQREYPLLPPEQLKTRILEKLR